MEPPPQVTLYELATGYYLSHALYLAAKWNVAELLADGPRQASELAATTSTHAPSLARMLRLLASAGVFTQQENGAFALTPLGACLRQGNPGSMRSMVMMFAGNHPHSAWQELEYCVRTGEPAFRKRGLVDPFSDPERTPEDDEIFDAAMADFSRLIAITVATAYDFSRIRTVVDVGGGNGALLIGLLQARPHLRGIVFDRPHVAERAARSIAESGLADRCAAVGGDFFTEVPTGGDAYVIKHVIHDWNDERALMILRNCRHAMGENGRVLIVEGVSTPTIDQSIAGRGAAANDINMLVNTGGRQRSESEFRGLCAAATFTDVRIVPTRGRVSIIEGRA
jgi:hypothetical protein